MTYNNTFGKIYKVKWPFTRLDESKLRPALAISDPNNFGDVEFEMTSSFMDRVVRAMIKGKSKL